MSQRTQWSPSGSSRLRRIAPFLLAAVALDSVLGSSASGQGADKPAPAPTLDPGAARKPAAAATVAPAPPPPPAAADAGAAKMTTPAVVPATRSAVWRRALPGNEGVAPKVRVWLATPTPKGLWTFRIDNEGAAPARVPADVRTMHIEIEDRQGRGKKITKCTLPAALDPKTFPDRRSLLLPPGESYVESFDPRLFCFGKNAAALRDGNIVRAYLGWPAAGRTPPFAVESTSDPHKFPPVKQVGAPPTLLSDEVKAKIRKDDDEGEVRTRARWTEDQWQAPNAPPDPKPPPGKPPPPREPTKERYTSRREARLEQAKRNRRRWDVPVNVVEHREVPKPKAPVPDDEGEAIVDEQAAYLDVITEPFLEAQSASKIVLRVKVANVGKRPTVAAVRPRMISIQISGPDGERECEVPPGRHGVPRESFRVIKPGQSVPMTLLLGEICSVEAFARPGLYVVRATLNATESGEEYGLSGYTGVSQADAPTLLRVATGTEPFYVGPPKSRLTSKVDAEPPPPATPPEKEGATNEPPPKKP
jgi:hypothetical protein